MPIFLSVFITLFLTLSARAQIIFLPQWHRSSSFEFALAEMSLNDPKREEENMVKSLMASGMEKAQAIRHAQADIKDRNEVILSQFKIFHVLKILAQKNPDILVGEESGFFNEESLRSLEESSGYHLLLGEKKYPIPRTYQSYLALREENPELEPKFYNAEGNLTKKLSPFGILDYRYSFDYLDQLRNKNIEIADSFAALSLEARQYLGLAGGLSLAISQGIIKNVAATENMDQEIHRYYQKVPLTPEEIAAKDLGNLRVYFHYLNLIHKYQAEMLESIHEFRRLNAQGICINTLVSLVKIRALMNELLKAVNVFKPMLKEDLAFVEALTRLESDEYDDQFKTAQSFLSEMSRVRLQLESEFKQRLFHETLDGREKAVLAVIKGILSQPKAPKNFVLIYGAGHDFIRHSSSEFPIIVPEMFWPDNRRAIIISAANEPTL